MSETIVDRVLRFVRITLYSLMVLYASIILYKVAPAIFGLAEPSLQRPMYAGFALILSAATILVIAQIVAAFLHQRKR